MARHISIRVKDDVLRRALRKAREQVRDMTPVYKLVGIKVREIVKGHFRQSRDPNGRPWKPLKSERTHGRDVAARGRRPGRASKLSFGTGLYKRGKPLIDRGTLLRSITDKAGPTRAVVGTNIKYAAIHNFGGRTRPHIILPRKKQALFWPGADYPVARVNHPGSVIPARTFMGLGSAEKADVVRVVQAAVARRVKGALGGA
jgi:phage gpG-like protein